MSCVTTLPGGRFVLKRAKATDEYRQRQRLNLIISERTAKRRLLFRLIVAVHRKFHGIPRCLTIAYLHPRGVAIENLRGGVLENARMSVEIAARVASTLLDGLEYMHRHHLLHRDLCPENIGFLEEHAVREGRVVNPDSVALIDFELSNWFRSWSEGRICEFARYRYASIGRMTIEPIRPQDDFESLFYAVLDRTDGVELPWGVERVPSEDDNDDNCWARTVAAKRKFQEEAPEPFRSAFRILNTCEFPNPTNSKKLHDALL